MNMAGRRVLVRAVLTVLEVSKKILKEVDKARRQFLWAQDENIIDTKCKVAWEKFASRWPRGGSVCWTSNVSVQLFGCVGCGLATAAAAMDELSNSM